MFAPALIVASLCSGAPPQIVKPVSLHDVSASGVLVDLELSAPAAVSVTVEGPGAPAPVLSEASAHPLIRIRGLQPQAAYHYACHVGQAVVAQGSFWTAPTRDAKSSFAFAVVGDARDHTQWASVARVIAEKSPRFVLDTGDSVNRGDAADWRDYYVAGQSLFSQTPVFATRGNHDLPEHYAEYNPAPAARAGPSTYAFTYGNAGFVTFDSNAPDEPTEHAFAERALAELAGGPLFVFQHHPPFSCGRHGSSAEVQAAYRSLFERFHVTVDFAGHDHDLIDWQPIGGVRYVVSGGGGTSPYALSGCEGQPFAKEGYGFVWVNVSGAEVTMTFFDERGIELHRTGPFRAPGPRVPAAELH